MPYFRKPKCTFYIYDEVVIHNKPHDFWVVIHGHVLNLTPLIIARLATWNRTLDYLLAFGGKDLSKYFFENGTPRMEISGVTGKPRVAFPPITETAKKNYRKCKIWSLDDQYWIGKITKQERPLRIINTLTAKTQCMVVCEEDTIYDIMKKYKRYNTHLSSYIWRKDYKNGTVSGRLNLNGTLTENGMIKNHEGVPPALWLFYNDDLTIG